jgi:hypothetical protein
MGEILAWGTTIAGARKLRHDMYREHEADIKLHYVYIEKTVIPAKDKASFARWLSVNCTRGKG